MNLTHLEHRSLRLRLGLLLLCSVAACGDGASKKDVSGDGQLVLGTGEATFEPLEDGQHLTLHAGTQGGHHVWLSMRVRGLDPNILRFTLDVTPSAPAPAAQSVVDLTFSPVAASEDPSAATDAGSETDDEWFEFVGWPARVLEPECAVGKPVELAVHLEDASGRTVEASAEIVLEPPALGFTRECER